MNSTILWASLAVIIAIAIGIGTFMAIGSTRAHDNPSPPKTDDPANAPGTPYRPGHEIDHICAIEGHTYQTFHTGWRCGRCGNYIARREGELYGPAEEGLLERRREPR